MWIPLIHSYDLNNNPVLYNIAKMCVKYNNDKVSLKDLIDGFRPYLFDDYFLSENISREFFERNIITHFLNRRIEFETFEFFKVKFMQTLTDALIKYNALFDVLFSETDIFSDVIERKKDALANRDGEVSTIRVDTTIENVNATTTDDRRFSDTPQNRINDVKSGEYVSDYTYTQDSAESERGSTFNGNEGSTHSDVDKAHEEEKIKNRNNTIERYKIYESLNNVMAMLYRDLEVCFLSTD